MKYQCEICGATFSAETDCNAHERKCRERNAAALYIADELNVLVGSASKQGVTVGVELTLGEGAEREVMFFPLKDAALNVAKNRITVSADQGETVLKKVEDEKKTTPKTKAKDAPKT